MPEINHTSIKKILPLLGGSLALLSGLCGLFGWLFGIEFLTTLLSDGATMKINTALLLMAGGTGLVLLIEGYFLPARWLFGFMIVLSLVIMAEHLLNTDLHIDQLFSKDALTNPAAEAPGRTSLLTALNMVLTGIALLLLSFHRYRSAQLLACCAYLLVYIALMGHLFHISGFYRLGRYSGVALHTAIGLLALAFGILSAAPHEGWIGIMERQLNRRYQRLLVAGYFLGSAPLAAALYLLLIQDGHLSPASEIIMVVAITFVLSLPVAYLILRLVSNMSRQLEITLSELKAVYAEVSAANQELAASNEEMATANEELAATNEELAASNEELVETHAVSRSLLAELEASETRFRFMLNAIPQQVWTARPNGALDYVNQVVCDNFGFITEEIVGHGWQAFIHPDDLTGCLEKWRNALSTGTEYVVEFRLKFGDGSYRWHLGRALPFAESGQIMLWLGTNTNIDLQKMNEQRKDEFLSIASHELKTPLTSIKAYNQIIQRITDPEKLKPFINKSADHIVRLERLISDLLDVTKINAGKMNYTLEPVNLKSLLKESVESVQHGIISHEIVLESAADVTFNGDTLRLEQVMYNFLNNAVKYSPGASKILVNGKVDQGNIIVSVQDFGIGIARENLDRLFDRYYRVDNTAMRFEGLGLGLFISAEILRRHGGSFWIESEQGTGSTFYFRLPLGGKEKPAVTRTTTYYRDQHLTINFNQVKKRLEVDWTGYHDLESVRHGCMLMWEFLMQNHCDRIVNDNTHVIGNWSEATDWVGNIWFPMMEKAGLKYFAHVFSPSTFSQLSAIKSIDIMNGIITTQYFTDIAQAEAWIDQQSEA